MEKVAPRQPDPSSFLFRSCSSSSSWCLFRPQGWGRPTGCSVLHKGPSSDLSSLLCHHPSLSIGIVSHIISSQASPKTNLKCIDLETTIASWCQWNSKLCASKCLQRLMEVCPFTRHDDPVSEKRPTAKVMVGWRRENIGWTFIQLQYRFFFKKCFYKYLFLSSFKFIVCTRTREDSCLIFEAVLCSCRLCLQTIFNLFSKESGSATKKKKERKNNLFWSDGVSVWARTPGGPVSLLITTKWGDEVRAWKKFKIHPPKHPGPSLPQCGSLILSKRGRERFRWFNK